jgi:hypothetical protein
MNHLALMALVRVEEEFVVALELVLGQLGPLQQVLPEASLLERELLERELLVPVLLERVK